MFGLNNILQKPTPIGLEISHDSVRMIQLCNDKGCHRVIAAAQRHLRESGKDQRTAVVNSIREMFIANPFRGKQVVSALPAENVRITSVRLNEIEEVEVEKQLRRELNERFETDTDNINYLYAGSVRHGDSVKHEFIMFSPIADAVSNQIQLIEDAGLIPAGIDVAPCALFRCFERTMRRQEDIEQSVVFVHIGCQHTIVVFGRSGHISFIKYIPIGGMRINEEVAAKLGIADEQASMLRASVQQEVRSSDYNYYNVIDSSTRQTVVDAITAVSEELARELSLCQRYYSVTFRGKRIERIIFSGFEAYDTILMNLLKKQLSVEIDIAEPLNGFDTEDVKIPSDRRGTLCEWAIPVGLAFKGTHMAVNIEDFAEAQA